MNTRRGVGQRLGSPATSTARVHAVSKEIARLQRLSSIELTPAKATLRTWRRARPQAGEARVAGLLPCLMTPIGAGLLVIGIMTRDALSFIAGAAMVTVPWAIPLIDRLAGERCWPEKRWPVEVAQHGRVDGAVRNRAATAQRILDELLDGAADRVQQAIAGGHPAAIEAAQAAYFEIRADVERLEQKDRHAADACPSELRVGSMVVTKVRTYTCERGERGVVYGFYAEDHAGQPYRGALVIFESGVNDEFSPDEQAEMLEPTGTLCHELAGYQCQNVFQLARDFDAGVFAPAFRASGVPR